MKLKHTLATLAGLAIAGLGLAGCATDAPADETAAESSETAETQVRNAAVSTVCTTEAGVEMTVLDFHTSWDFSSPGDAIADCTGSVLVEGELTDEQAAAAEALGQPGDIEAVAPLYGYCADPEFGGLLETDLETVDAALNICPEHPLAGEVQ